jgi:hypothetical protein
MTWNALDALGESTDAPSRGQVEALAGIRLPRSADDVRARLDQVLTKRTIFVRLTVDRGELDSVLGRPPFDGPLSSAAVPVLLTAEPRPGWFRPERARLFVAGEAARSAVLADVSDPAQPVLYVVARS